MLKRHRFWNAPTVTRLQAWNRSERKRWYVDNENKMFRPLNLITNGSDSPKANATTCSFACTWSKTEFVDRVSRPDGTNTESPLIANQHFSLSTTTDYFQTATTSCYENGSGDARRDAKLAGCGRVRCAMDRRYDARWIDGRSMSNWFLSRSKNSIISFYIFQSIVVFSKVYPTLVRCVADWLVSVCPICRRVVSLRSEGPFFNVPFFNFLTTTLDVAIDRLSTLVYQVLRNWPIAADYSLYIPLCLVN